MTIPEYIDNIAKRYKLGNATEHTFRGDLQYLIESLVPEIRATNEPKRQACGAPDYIITKKDIPVGFIEAKDIGDKDLDGIKKTGNKEQFDRYKSSLNNLIFTDYLNFHLYRDGEFVIKVSIGEVTDKGIVALQENFLSFISIIKEFCSSTGQTIKSSKKLAEMMAAKARLLSTVIEKALSTDNETNEIYQDNNNTLLDQYQSFKDILIHDITIKGFADIYSQTIAYGMFAARLHDTSLDDFSRKEAADLIPKSNPFLRKLFQYIAGYDLDDRIKWIVDALAEIFRATNVVELLADFGKATQQTDPIIHFYETFLSEYDPKLRKSRGVWYTPEPVVNFIVRAVDDILKTEFDLPNGLADTSKTNIKVRLQETDKRYSSNFKTIDREVHKVQILDPATGTGTFLAEVIKHIYKKFKGQQGIWNNYVDEHLISRLNGFELLMASYAMAHLKLDLLLKETGYISKTDKRLNVYLTNSLEEHHKDTGTLFASWLSNEANEANRIKRDTPVMVIIGNPPYSVSSSNKSDWIEGLVASYKKELNEKNIQPLSDDYIKFIRFGQHFVEKNGSGILAYISNNSFIDGIIHRQMRKNLLETFDKIYILDLHGNSKKKEICPDGSPDQNVFDIMQGVSINIFVKTGNKKENQLGKVFHSELYGKRDSKYLNLNSNSLKTINWNELGFNKKSYFFVPKDFHNSNAYERGFRIDQVFKLFKMGSATGKDEVFVDLNQELLKHRLIRNGIIFEEANIKPYNYRVFDKRSFIYDNNLIQRLRVDLQRHFFDKNIALVTTKILSSKSFQHIFLSEDISDRCLISNKGQEGNYFFPLYIYSQPEKNKNVSFVKENTIEYSTSENELFEINEPRFVYNSLPYKPNLDRKIIGKIEESLGIPFIVQYYKEDNSKFGELDLLDYIYAVLHSPSYREKYKEFLKIDFPRVPYPTDKEKFWSLVTLGGELRQIHLLESPIVEEYITTYPISGDNEVLKPDYKNGKVYINESQYFENVPEIAWNFYIGGYQPAQKWLKDRKGRNLNFEDILHYQKIIVALTETDRLMKEIDKIDSW